MNAILICKRRDSDTLNLNGYVIGDKCSIRYKAIISIPRFVVSIEIRWELAGDINQITINKISFILIIRLFHIQHFVKRIHHGMFVTRLL